MSSSALNQWVLQKRELDRVRTYGKGRVPFYDMCVWATEGSGRKLIGFTDIDPKLRNKLHGSNALQNGCYMCLLWTRVLYSIVKTRQSNPPISQFNNPCNEFPSFWSMFEYNTIHTNLTVAFVLSLFIILLHIYALQRSGLGLYWSMRSALMLQYTVR